MLRLNQQKLVCLFDSFAIVRYGEQVNRFLCLSSTEFVSKTSEVVWKIIIRCICMRIILLQTRLFHPQICHKISLVKACLTF